MSGSDKATVKKPSSVQNSQNSWEKALEKMASQGGGTSARLAVVSLSQVRARVGEEEFSRVRKRINLAIQTVLGKLLSPADQVLQVGSETYLVLVRSMAFEDAQALIQQGCDALARLFFGDETLNTITFQADLSEVLPPHTSREPQCASISTTPAEPHSKPVTPDQSEAPAPETSFTPSSSKPASRWRSMATSTQTGIDFEINYVPTWDATNKVLSTFTAGCWAANMDGQLHDKLHELADGNATTLAHLDAQLVEEACDILAELFSNAFALLVIIPLHYSALTSTAGREIIASALREIPPHMRKLISLEILGTPLDMDPRVLSDKVSQLKTFARSIVLAVDDWNPSVDRLAKAADVSAVGLFLPRQGPARQRLIGSLGEFATSMQRAKRIPALIQVQTKSEIHSAVDAGVTYLTGSGIGLPEDLPGNMVRCSMSQLPYSSQHGSAAKAG